jgi:twitching motility protein PilT
MDTHTISLLFEKAAGLGASDVHVAVGAPVLFRIDGALTSQTKQDMTPAAALSLVRAVLGAERMKRFEAEREIDVSFALKGGLRVRVNCHYERGNVGMAARLIPAEIPSLEDVGLTELFESISAMRGGLVLFTGPTGCGKSTSLAVLLQELSTRESHSIVTLEDPIEFVFPKGKGIIRQRELGLDFRSFPEALKRVLRQDPDIVMVGEMRDPETIAAALTLAETGHLIFATLHTPNAMQAIDRIIDGFPPHQQAQVRSQLSLSLRAVIGQTLLPRVKGGRVALREVLVNVPAVAHTIRDNRTQELVSVMQTNEDAGMITFDKAAKKLLKEGAIAKETYEWVAKAGR